MDTLAECLVMVHRLMHQRFLVSGTNGNASCFDPASATMIIKASGLQCGRIDIKDLVTLNIDGSSEEGGSRLRPSVDAPLHLEVYRKRAPQLRGIVHTHSPYATAFAACSRPIPAIITSIADVFGTEIPCAPYMPPESDLGGALAELAQNYPGCLLARHGVFAFGRNPEAALENAILIEEAAKTVYLALTLGPAGPLEPEEVAKWRVRYLTKYGQDTKS